MSGTDLEREVGHALDRQPRRDLDDQRVVALHRRVAARPRRRAHGRRELPAQVVDRQVDAELDRRQARGSALRSRSACRARRGAAGSRAPRPARRRVEAVSAPASVAALTAPTSPWHTTATSPSPTCSRDTMVDVRGLHHRVGGGERGDVALRLDHSERLAHGALLRGGRGRLVERPDDQRVDRRVRVAEPARGDRAGGDQHALADAAAEDVEGDQRRAVVRPHLEEGAARQLRRRGASPRSSRSPAFQHRFSFSISTPSARAFSRASGVSTARGPSTRRAAGSRGLGDRALGDGAAVDAAVPRRVGRRRCRRRRAARA